MSELALKLIAENKAKYERGEDASYLDLGNCGLTELPDLSGMEWLETLILSAEWWKFDVEKNTEVKFKSQNRGESNQFEIILAPQLQLPLLKNLVVCDLGISDVRILENLTTLQSLVLSGNRIRNVDFLKYLTNLQSLYLSDTQISNWDFLKNLTHLRSLYLSDNYIIDGHFLEHLTELDSLHLNDNYIDKWHFLGNMRKLKNLNLSGNLFSDWSCLEKLPNLTSLYLSRNKINNGRFLAKLTHLQSLDLSENQISDWSCLENLTNLTSLYLSRNKINNGRFLAKLTHLQSLDLSENEISNADFLKNLTNLQSLNLSRNQISNADYLKNLTNLQSLDLSRNQISNVDFLKNLTDLQSLDISENAIINVGFLTNLTNLQSLDLSRNQISNVDFLINLTNLQFLDLNRNKISNVDFLKNSPHLQSIDLSENEINNADFLKNLTDLQSIDLEYNEISNLEPFLLLIEKKIPVTLDRLKQGECINLFRNPITHPPIEIVKQGNAAILRYFEDLEKEGVDQIYEAKLLLIGEGGAGKTSLCRKLFDPEAQLPQEKDRTKGIDIHPLYFDIPGKPDKTFRLNIWDFGGQGKYQSAHSFFYTHRSLYVLVDDTRTLNENEAWRALYNNWLQTAELFGGHSPVLVLHNEKDGCARMGFSIGNFQAHFTFVYGELFRINLGGSEIEKITDLRRQIERQALALPHIGDTVPKTWVKVREAIEIERQEHPYISADYYRDLCKAAGISDPERQSDLSRYFHDLGVFLHFQDNPLLKHDVFLQNQWVTDAVYKILDDAQIAETQRGRFDKNDLARLWSEGAYRERRDELLALMLQFELCYQVQDTETYVCPQLLPGDLPPYGLGPDNPLQLKYEYVFMPKGLLYRLIVRLHRHIARGQTAVWNSGVVLERQGVRADIIESLDRRTISVRATGLRAKELVTIIHDALEGLHEHFGERLRITVRIPCSCRICKSSPMPHFYDKTDLDDRIENGKQTVECKVKPYENVNVKGLLEGVFVKDTPRVGVTRSQANTTRGMKLFISYSKHDTPYKDTLLKHLSGLRNKIVTWHDRDILPGEDWDELIKAALHEADVVLYLVTHNSLATDYIQQVELPLVEERCAAGECILVPVIVDFCDWTELDFANRNALPEKGTPVTDGKWKNENEAWVKVVEGVRQILAARENF